MKTILANCAIGISVTCAILFGIYALVAGMAWLSKDPLNIVADDARYKDQQTDLWDECIQSTRSLFDKINHTKGTTYALEDLPSESVKSFMQFCLEESTKN